MSRFVENVKRTSGLEPTLFHIGDMWRINRSRCGGRFNLLFFWLYPLVAVYITPYTVLCMIEVALKSCDQSG